MHLLSDMNNIKQSMHLSMKKEHIQLNELIRSFLSGSWNMFKEKWPNINSMIKDKCSGFVPNDELFIINEWMLYVFLELQTIEKLYSVKKSKIIETEIINEIRKLDNGQHMVSVLSNYQNSWDDTCFHFENCINAAVYEFLKQSVLDIKQFQIKIASVEMPCEAKFYDVTLAFTASIGMWGQIAQKYEINYGNIGVIKNEKPAIGIWSWGAFSLSWLYFLAMGSKIWILYIFMLAIFFQFQKEAIPVISLVWVMMKIIAGFIGNKISWKSRKWDNLAQFHAVQLKWDIWGFAILMIPFITGILFSIILIIKQNRG